MDNRPSEDNERNKPLIQLHVKLPDSLPRGARVCFRGNFEKTPQDPNKGWDKEYAADPPSEIDDRYSVFIPIDFDQEYSYKITIQLPGEPHVRWYPDENLKLKAVQNPRANQTPLPPRPPQRIPPVPPVPALPSVPPVPPAATIPSQPAPHLPAVPAQHEGAVEQGQGVVPIARRPEANRNTAQNQRRTHRRILLVIGGLLAAVGIGGSYYLGRRDTGPQNGEAQQTPNEQEKPPRIRNFHGTMRRTGYSLQILVENQWETFGNKRVHVEVDPDSISHNSNGSGAFLYFIINIRSEAGVLLYRYIIDGDQAVYLDYIIDKDESGSWSTSGRLFP